MKDIKANLTYLDHPHILVSSGYNLVDLNIVEGDPTVQLSFQLMPTTYLSVAYLPRDPAFYFCNRLNRGATVPDDRCWRLKLGKEDYEEV